MNNEKEFRKKPVVGIGKVRALIQLLAFILIPELFITILGSIEEIYKAIIGGKFNIQTLWPSLLLLGAVIIVSLVWGRFFCGFMCSFGAMQDLLWAIGRHIPFHPVISEKADRIFKKFKYLVLAAIVIFVWTLALPKDIVWSPWTVFGMYVSPWKGLPTEAVFLSLGGGILLLAIVGSLFVERCFCTYACPMGAVYALLSHFRVFRIKKPVEKCGKCTLCTKKCSMSIPLYKYDKVTSGECINCMKCTEVCPKDNANMSLAPEVTGVVTAAALAGVSLLGTMPDINLFGSGDSGGPKLSGEYNDGTFMGFGNGYKGVVKVAVAIENGRIKSIGVISYEDDKRYFRKAQSGVLSAIMEQQRSDVDAISTATYSSQGLMEAVTDALQYAKKG